MEEAYDKTVGGEATPPASIFGKRRMARAEPVTLALRAPAGGEGQAFQLAYGPLPFSSWQGHESFIANLRGFWAALTFRPRARGVQGTTWVELWIAYEMTYGGCPRKAKARGSDGPLDIRPQARVLLANFSAASRWLLRPSLIGYPTLFGGTATRGLAFKHLAVSTTTAALDACFCWDPGFLQGGAVEGLVPTGGHCGYRSGLQGRAPYVSAQETSLFNDIGAMVRASLDGQLAQARSGRQQCCQ